LANVSKKFSELRDYLTSIGDSAQDTAKKSNNSCYGLSKEGIDTYVLIDGTPERAGLRAGEQANDITATMITALARIQICEVAEAIEKNGGRVLTIMTDSVFFDGDISMFPAWAWTEKKTLGYFEKPDELHNFICLGAGRYEFMKKDKESGLYDSFKNKSRGFSVADIISDDGVVLDKFNWNKALMEAQKTRSTIIKMPVRILVSVGMVLNNKDYPLETLGKIVDVDRKVDIIAGKEKRYIPTKDLIDKMQEGIVYSKPHYWEKDCMGDYDMTLPFLRKHVMNLEVLSPGEIDRKRKTRKNGRKWQNIKDEYMKRYYYCRAMGADSRKANKLAKTGWENIYKIYGKEEN
jgi:hypothetical protein